MLERVDYILTASSELAQLAIIAITSGDQLRREHIEPLTHFVLRVTYTIQVQVALPVALRRM